ncbi:hypothetical protein HDU87_000462 [Geranomyces variabilis]|uniref:Uncharacterized protein n=1 Tax=Geranomyces variabilis TaxID=109894 RepID=A0AAD5TCA9_9FUNG|nr:hypothetical protein HDU87_000462 [Geranomyces variabilis]
MAAHAAASLSTLHLVPFSELLKVLPVKDRHALAQCSKQLRQNSLALDPALRAYVALRALIFDRLGTVPSAEEPFDRLNLEDWDWEHWPRGDTCKALIARLEAFKWPSQLPPGWRCSYLLEDYAKIHEFSEERMCAAVDIPLPCGRKLRVSCLGRLDSNGYAEPEWVRFFVQEVGENDGVIVYNVYPSDDRRYSLQSDFASSALATAIGYKDPHGSWKQPNDLGHGESESGCEGHWHTSDVDIPGVDRWLSCEEVEQIDIEEVREELSFRSDGYASDGVPPFFPHLATYSPELDDAVEASMAHDVDETTWVELASVVNRLHARSTLDCYPSTVARLLHSWHRSQGGVGHPAVPSDPVVWAQQNIIYSRWAVDEAAGRLSQVDDLAASSRSVMEFRVKNAAGDPSYSMKFVAQSANAPGRPSLDIALFDASGTAVMELALKPQRKCCDDDKIGIFRIDVAGLEHIHNTCGFEAQWPDAGMFGVLLLAVGFCGWQRNAGLPRDCLKDSRYCYPWTVDSDERAVQFESKMFKFVSVNTDDNTTPFSRADTYFSTEWFVVGSA